MSSASHSLTRGPRRSSVTRWMTEGWWDPGPRPPPLLSLTPLQTAAFHRGCRSQCDSPPEPCTPEAFCPWAAAEQAAPEVGPDLDRAAGARRGRGRGGGWTWAGPGAGRGRGRGQGTACLLRWLSTPPGDLQRQDPREDCGPGGSEAPCSAASWRCLDLPWWSDGQSSPTRPAARALPRWPWLVE